jgi:hypothetical protein
VILSKSATIAYVNGTIFLFFTIPLIVIGLLLSGVS